MHSSTSSFSLPVPPRNTAAAIVAALCVAAAACLAWEALWRSRGFTARENITAEQWAYRRLAIPDNDPSAVVFAGTSRSHRALIPEEWERATGMRAHQLSIPGGIGQVILRHFADDPNFTGLIILDVTPATYLGYDWMSLEHQTRTARYAELWRQMRASPAKRIETALRLFLERRMVSFSPRLSAKNLLGRVFAGYRFLITHIPDFEEIEDPELMKDQQRNHATAAHHRIDKVRALPRLEWEARRRATARELAESVEKIHARGGQVVFVEHPTSGDVYKYDNIAYPREAFWDYFAEKVPGIWINFADYAPTHHFEAIDLSHLSLQTARTYTPKIAYVIAQALEKYVPERPRIYTENSPMGQFAVKFGHPEK